MSIIEFCNRHNACPEGRDWAMANCWDMDHAWYVLKPEWLIWVATRDGVLDDRTLRLFAVWCARQVQHLMTDPRSVAALDAAERFANGEAAADELTAAAVAAVDATAAWWDNAWAAARASAGAAEAAARSAADRASTAARAAARASATAKDEAIKRQADWLRANAKPRWEAKP